MQLSQAILLVPLLLGAAVAYGLSSIRPCEAVPV